MSSILAHVTSAHSRSRTGVVARYGFNVAAACIGIAGAVVSVAFLVSAPAYVMFVVSIMFGFSEANGLCGTSHVGSITPLRVLGRGQWHRAAAAYTFGGIVTASLVGSCVGWVGQIFGIGPLLTAWLMLPLSVVLAAREVGWASFALPQVHRQTDKMWALQYGFTVGAGMWGAHIGLSFFTVIRHGGFYVLTLAALGHRPMSAAILFALYWLGRTIPVWAAPLVASPSMQRHGGAMGALVLEADKALAYLAAVGLVLAASASALYGLDPLLFR